MFDLQGIGMNIVLVGFVLLAICILYLLYTNFKKTREIDALNQKVEDLKTIFFNQQKHNDLAQGQLAAMIQQSHQIVKQHASDSSSRQQQHTNDAIEDVDVIVTEDNDKVTQEQLVLNHENLVKHNKNDTVNIKPIVIDDSKNEEIDLKELDKMDEPQNDDEIVEEISDYVQEIDADIMLENDDNELNSAIYKKKLEKIDINDINADLEIDLDMSDLKDIGDDELADSIRTDPIQHDLDEIELDIDLEEINNVIEKQSTNELNLDLNEFECGLVSNQNTTKSINIDENADLTELNFSLTKGENVLATDAKKIQIDKNANPLTELTFDKVVKLDDNNSKNVDVLQELLNGSGPSGIANNEKTIQLDTDDSTSTNLNTMSLKQLKELAKQHKIKPNANKQELIAALSKVLQQNL